MPERAATWEDIVRHEATVARVPPALALAVARAESGGDPSTPNSAKGAQGMFQLMPGTAKDLGVNPKDPIENIRGGVRYLRQMLDQAGGDVTKALTAYNWGPGNVAKGGSPPPETSSYVSRILSSLGGQPGVNLQTAPVKSAVATPPPTGKPQSRLIPPDATITQGAPTITGSIRPEDVKLGMVATAGMNPSQITGIFSRAAEKGPELAEGAEAAATAAKTFKDSMYNRYIQKFFASPMPTVGTPPPTP